MSLNDLDHFSRRSVLFNDIIFSGIYFYYLPGKFQIILSLKLSFIQKYQKKDTHIFFNSNIIF